MNADNMIQLPTKVTRINPDLRGMMEGMRETHETLSLTAGSFVLFTANPRYGTIIGKVLGVSNDTAFVRVANFNATWDYAVPVTELFTRQGERISD
jgi:hypothetical protein